MANKIKATLTFVKIFPLINERKEERITIVGDGEDGLNTKISPVIGSWVSTETNEAGDILYQCYLKNIEKGNINYVPEIDFSNYSVIPSAEDVLNYIIDNRVQLIPTDETWLDKNDSPVNITHNIRIGKTNYSGLTIEQAIAMHINRDEEVL